MEITKRKSGDTIVIELSGSLDIYTATDFKTYLQSNVKTENSKVVVNMEKLNYMKELNGHLQLANLKESLQKIFKVAGLTAYFQFLSEKEFKEKYLA